MLLTGIRPRLGLLHVTRRKTGAITPPPPAYDADAVAYWQRGATEPNAAQKQKLSDFVAALKSAGIWSVLDVLQLYGAPYSDLAPLNMVGTSYTAAPTNSPTWAAVNGYTTDGSTSYIDTSFQQGGFFTQNNAAYGLQFATTVPGTTSYALGIDGSGPTKLVQWNTATTLNWRINASGSANSTAPRSGFFHFARQSSSQAEFAVDNAASTIVSSGSGSASVAPGANNFLIGRHAGNYIAVTVPIFYAGGYLTDTQKAAFTAALAAYRS